MVKKILCALCILFVFYSCSKDSKPQKDIGKKDIDEKEVSDYGVYIQSTKEDLNIDDKEGYGILLVRFKLDPSDKNKLSKLPNFRIKGTKSFVIDNSPSSIQKDAIHIYTLPQGTYSISSLYAVNQLGQYEFDRPFPSNSFYVESKKVNYIGDIIVMLEEEEKSETVVSRKLKLKLPNDNDKTIEIIKDKYADIIEKYSLLRRIISFK